MSYVYCNVCIASSSFLNVSTHIFNSLKTENTKTLTYNSSSVIVWKSDWDKLILILLWYFKSRTFHLCPLLNRIYIQQHFGLFIRRLVTRHLILLLADWFLSKWMAIGDTESNFLAEWRFPDKWCLAAQERQHYKTS